MKMRRYLALLLSLILMFSVIGCAAGTKPTEPKENEQTPSDIVQATVSDTEEVPEFKIGFMYFSFTDVLGQQYKRAGEYFCDKFNCESMFVETGGDLEAWVTGAQNLIESGCDAVMCSLNSIPVMKLCEDAGVLYFACNVPWDDAEWLNELQTMKYSVGQIVDDDVSAATAGIDALYEAGCRNVAIVSPNPGFLVHDLRFNAAKAQVEQYSDMNLVAEYRGDEQGEGTTQLAALYPDMDGIMIVANDGKANAAYYNEGLDTRGVKLATIDVAAGTEESIKAGNMVFCATAQYTTWYAELILVYNKLLGDDLVPDKNKPIQRKMVYVKSWEDYENVDKYIGGDVPCYTGEEMKEYIKYFNPNVTTETILEMNANFSLQDVMERHATLVQ